MKNHSLRLIGCLLLLAASMGLQSCEYDGDNDVAITHTGLWDLTKEVVDDGVRTSVYDRESDTDMFIELFTDGDFQIYRSLDYYYDLEAINSPDYCGYWSISGSRLILTFDSHYEEYWDIANLTGSTMQLEYVPYDGEKNWRTRTFKRVDVNNVTFIGEDI